MTQKNNATPGGEVPHQDPKRLRELLAAPETKRLMELLKRQNGSQLRTAAEAARKGDSSALSEMLHKLSDSREGSDAMKGLESRLNR